MHDLFTVVEVLDHLPINQQRRLWLVGAEHECKFVLLWAGAERGWLISEAWLVPIHLPFVLDQAYQLLDSLPLRFESWNRREPLLYWIWGRLLESVLALAIKWVRAKLWKIIFCNCSGFVLSESLEWKPRCLQATNLRPPHSYIFFSKQSASVVVYSASICIRRVYNTSFELGPIGGLSTSIWKLFISCWKVFENSLFVVSKTLGALDTGFPFVDWARSNYGSIELSLSCVA